MATYDNAVGPRQRAGRARPRLVVIALLAAMEALSIHAGPGGMTVVRGNVIAVQNGPQLNITASHNSVINWQSFNIAAGETTTFIQPSSTSVVWNRIADRNPSQIWGNLNANGIVVLMNQNGFYFGPHSSVTCGGFIATSAAVAPPPGVGGGMWNFQGPPPTANIINYGQIRVQSGGSLFLISDAIENHGLLSAPDGKLGLYAGKQVMISERPDGRGLSANVRLPDGSIDNSGQIIADGGIIALHAQIVNQNGLIQANSVRNQNGVIELITSDAVHLGPNSVIQANGDPTVVSDGGRITIKSGQTFSDDPNSRLEVRGGALGGNGGSVELSAANMDQINSQLDGTAQAGWTSGNLLLDPYNILLSTVGITAPSGNVPYNSPPTATGSTLQINVNQAFRNFSQITLQALNNISLASGTTWDLNASTGISTPGSQLTLEAGNDIIFNNNSKIQAGAGWSVNLAAGVDFTSPTLATVPSAAPGTHGIYLGGLSSQGVPQNFNGSIQAADGNITLNAGREVIVGSGFVRTINGGNISIATGNGDVVSGTDAATYDFLHDGYAISSLGLGGIGTANGGDVTIHAGGNILSFVASIGAFGVSSGNVTLTANGNIAGNFMIRNGTGTIIAGEQVQNPDGPNPQVTQVLNPNADVGTASTGVNLGIAGGGENTPGWNVFAAHDIFVNEVFNPNGSLNADARVPFQFDYAPDAFVNLAGGNSVQLLGINIAHTSSNPARPPIYAPILDITAGAGGVVLGNDVVLYPSPLGSLNIRTTDGGSLSSSPGTFNQLIVSDSGSPDYTTFISGHADTPLHLGGTGAGVHLDISGDIQNIFLSSPEAADIHVHGNALNFSFQGQNLSPNDVTRLQIDGDYFNRSDRTFIALQDAPTAAIFNAIFNDAVLATDPDLNARLTYDPKTHQLGIQGIMTLADLAFLLHPTTYVLDPATQQPKVDANGNPIIVPAAFSTDTAAIQQLYAATQDIPTSPLAFNGMQIGGPGQFNIGAHNMDLGITSGIRSVGPLLNPALASAVSAQGANININLTGNLDMGSSQIASFNGGSITVNSLGKVDVGSQNSFTSDDTPKGIYTADGGDVTVHAEGDINVDGSRIASYNGGDVTVISDNGSVDAGSGGKGFFYITTSELNPITGELETRNDKFFGSGIMATTRPDSLSEVGNITIDARGDVLINAGGVVQIPFNNLIRNSAGTIIGNLNPATGIITAYSGLWGAQTAGANNNPDADAIITIGRVSSGGTIVGPGGGIVGRVNSNGTVTGSDGRVIGSEETPIVANVMTVVHKILGELLSKGKSSGAGGNHSSGAKVVIESFAGSVNASHNGVLAQNLDVSAPEGSIEGIFATAGNANIQAQQSVSVTLVAGGTANVSGQTVTGSVVGGGDVSVSGSDITASVISTGGTATSGGTTSTGNAFTGVAAAATQTTAADADKTVASQTLTQTDDEDEKKKRAAGNGPALSHRVGRVTVILPKS